LATTIPLRWRPSDAAYDNLAELTLDASLLQSCGITERNFGGNYTFYCVGTVLATTVWKAAGEDEQRLADEWMPIVVTALPAVGASIVASGGDFDLDVVVEALAAAASPGRVRDDFCREARLRFATLVDTGRVPSCL
jgi:hypothetical protein